MRTTAGALAAQFWSALGGSEALLEAVAFSGDGELSSAYPVTELAGAAVAVAALSIAELRAKTALTMPEVRVDRRLASFWFASSLRPIGWSVPPQWDPIAGDYPTKDGWIRLHTNAPHHRAAAERILGAHADKAAMARAVAAWSKRDLENAVVEAGGCAAEMRSVDDWTAHPQGRAIAAEPLVHVEAASGTAPLAWTPRDERPLAGVRVLDLTRVLAGPVASRFLAGYGAEVLRIDPPWWDEPAVVPDMTVGKRCARLDLRDVAGRRRFEELLSGAHILLHGYRPGALEGLGYDPAGRRAISPGLVDVALCAYGWSGPWAGRRGFDSLVQMSAGIAHAGMAWKRAETPVPLPVQALDHATGYLMAAAAVRGILRRMAGGKSTLARLSLARTAKLLTDLGEEQTAAKDLQPESASDLSRAVEHTAWGEARRLLPPVVIAGSPVRWDLPAHRLGSDEPVWRENAAAALW